MRDDEAMETVCMAVLGWTMVDRFHKDASDANAKVKS